MTVSSRDVSSSDGSVRERRAERDARALNNLAVALDERGRRADAAEALRKAVAADPNCADAWLNLAQILVRQGDATAAVAVLVRALDHIDSSEVRRRLGEAMVADGRVADATEQFFQVALANGGDLCDQLRAACAGEEVQFSNADTDAYRQRLEAKLRELAERPWRLDLDRVLSRGVKPPVFLAYHGHNDRTIKTLFGDLFGRAMPRDECRPRKGKPHVGFVVTKGNEGIFLRGMAGVLRRLDPSRLRVTLLCDKTAREAAAQAIASRAVEIRSLPQHLPQAVGCVRDAELDLVYFWEVGTDCLNYLLACSRLAPVQCTSWGWPVTSGLATVDVFLSSRRLEPSRGSQHYRERLVLLDRFPHFYKRPSVAESLGTRESLGWSSAQHIYLCVQNPRKLQPDFDALLAGILRADARGRVVLMASSRPSVTARLRERFTRTMGDVAARVDFAPRTVRSGFLGLLTAADVVLDTVHYGGGANTTYDAFSVAAPLVTLPTEFHRGRYAMAAYRAMGLDDLIAYSAEQYIAKAVQVASDREYRAALQSEIRRRSEVLFEDSQAVAELEEFFVRTIAAARDGA